MSFTYCPECGGKQTVQKHDDTNYECTACGWHFWNNAKAAATAIILRKDGTFLVTKRAREPFKGGYDAPGGFLDYGEDPAVAAAREAREETGLTIKNPILMATHPHSYLPDNHPPVSSVDIIFAVTEWEGEPTPGDDAAELLWKPLEFIDSEKFVTHYPGLVDKLRNLLAKNS